MVAKKYQKKLAKVTKLVYNIIIICSCLYRDTQSPQVVVTRVPVVKSQKLAKTKLQNKDLKAKLRTMTDLKKLK